VDKRTDIWSFGVMLYEMLTGKQLFADETVSDTLAAVLRADIDWNLLSANTPASIRTLLRRSLNKDRKERLRDIGEARITIAEYLANSSGASMPGVAVLSGGRKLRERLAWCAVVLLVAVSAALGIVYYRNTSEPRQVMRFEYTLPENEQFTHSESIFLAVSPDGRQFAYHTNKGLFVQSIGKLNKTQLVGPNENPSNPFFSPDGEYVAYRSLTDNMLKKVATKGGTPISICTIGAFSGAFWSDDDTIFCGEYGKGMLRIPANGGTTQLVFPEDGGANYYHPQLLPDAKSLLFTLGPYPYSIVTRPLGSAKGEQLINPGAHAHYLPTGHLIYGLGNYLYAVLFNPSKHAKPNNPIRMEEDVFRLLDGYPPQFEISATGTLVYAPGRPSKRTLVWVDKNGNEEPLKVDAKEYDSWASPKISPDGTKAALTVNAGGNSTIWILDLNRNNMNPLTSDEAGSGFAVWESNDRIIYRSSRDASHSDINTITANGSGKPTKLSPVPNRAYPLSLSKDGKTLLLWELAFTAPPQSDIVALSLEGSGARTPLLHEQKYDEHNPQISPDGQWLAYVSDKSGKLEVYMRPYTDVERGGERQVSEGGGYGPLWSRDGTEIFYRYAESVMAVTVETKPSMKLGRPKTLFTKPYCYSYVFNTMFPSWDISGDDKRFLMMKEDEPPAGLRKIVVVINWTEELKQRVPIK
jgi:Tol biopolymer transport system component